MQALSRLRWWAAALLLAGGCRSEQVAFSFRPATTFTHPAPILPAPATPTGATPPGAAPVAGPTISTAGPAPTPVRARPPRPALATGLARRSATFLPVRGVVRQPHQSAAAARPARRTDLRDTGHLVLGGLLVVAGIVTGLVLGGWLGLGVGAVLVLAGYYFALLGIGGRHAWLEIFQEFFNM